jgi:hypothetical protein
VTQSVWVSRERVWVSHRALLGQCSGQRSLPSGQLSQCDRLQAASGCRAVTWRVAPRRWRTREPRQGLVVLESVSEVRVSARACRPPRLLVRARSHGTASRGSTRSRMRRRASCAVVRRRRFWLIGAKRSLLQVGNLSPSLPPASLPRTRARASARLTRMSTEQQDAATRVMRGGSQASISVDRCQEITS